jgi:hypothetical protein
MRITLFFVDRPDLTLFVIAAMRADAMRSFRLVALRAESCRRGPQRVVRAAFGCPGLRMSAFWIRHVSSSALYRNALTAFL